MHALEIIFFSFFFLGIATFVLYRDGYFFNKEDRNLYQTFKKLNWRPDREGFWGAYSTDGRWEIHNPYDDYEGHRIYLDGKLHREYHWKEKNTPVSRILNPVLDKKWKAEELEEKNQEQTESVQRQEIAATALKHSLLIQNSNNVILLKRQEL